jgi:hypothetical protein
MSSVTARERGRKPDEEQFNPNVDVRMTARFPVALFSYPLSPGAKLLYLRLAWYCGREAGGAAWAGGGKFKKGSRRPRFVVCNSRDAAAGEMGLNISIRHARCAVAMRRAA